MSRLMTARNKVLLKDVPDRFPDLLPGVTYRAMVVWARVGVGGVKLETIKIGSRIWTDQIAVEQFLQKTNAGVPAVA